VRSRELKVAILANEFFDPSLGRMGGFGWVAQQAALTLTNSSEGVEALYLTGELYGSDDRRDTTSFGIRLIFNDDDAAAYEARLRREDVDLIVAIDYRPNFDPVLAALADVPLVVWVQDPRPAADVSKVDSLRIPGAEQEHPKGISAIDCTPFAAVAAEADKSGRPLRYVSPAPTLQAKAEATYGVHISELRRLPYCVDLELAEVKKPKEPRVIFLGRLDPIKRPWIFVEAARAFPSVEFLVLGQSHFEGPGSWRPSDLPDNVRMLGHVSGDQKAELLRSAWILVNSSIHEALPVSFVEALAYEVPIVSCQDPEGVVSKYGQYTGRYDGSGLDAVRAFVAGVQRLLEDDALRQRLGQSGREWSVATHGQGPFLEAFGQLRHAVLG
jgi:glycosyltransferase involved in cell wall biosynthesis